MEDFEEYQEQIERYLEQKMTQEEEELFMQQLNENEALRKQYEDELLISALLENEAEDNSESLSDINDGQKLDIANNKKIVTKQLFAIHRRTWYIAAAAILIIAFTGILLTLKTNNKNDIAVKQTNPKNDIHQSDSLISKQPDSINKDSLGKQLYNQFYTSYIAKNDPVGVSNYYKSYKDKKYDNVIAASKNAYQTLGLENRQVIVDAYMDLYKGLCYLEKNEPEKAITIFNSILKIGNDTTERYFYETQWYLALCYLKSANIDMASTILHSITQRSSPYKKRAEEILTQLK